MAAEICRVHDAEIYCSFDFMRYVYMPAQMRVRCSFGTLGTMAPKLGPDALAGHHRPKSDSGVSRRSRKNQSESGRSGRSGKNRDARSATLKGQVVEEKDEEEPTVAAEEPPSLPSVRLTVKSGCNATAASSSSMAAVEKTCPFMCGALVSSPDPLEPEKRKFCRWARDPPEP